jgi:glycosyltransferase involved in cell wall biosynthesis
MKILFSLTYYCPYISGLTIFVKSLAENTAKKNNKVYVLCFRHDGELPEREMLNNVSVIRVNPWLKINKGFLSGEWVIHSWLLVKKNDVVVINLPQIEGLITALIAKILSKKVVAIYICHVDTKNFLLNFLLESINSLVLTMADKVVTLTEDYANNSGVLAKFKHKINYAYPLILKPEVDDVWKRKAKQKIGKCNVVIGVAARLAAEKGLEYLLDAIPKLKRDIGDGFRIAIAGPTNSVGEEKYKYKVAKLAKKYRKEVVFLGKVPDGMMGSFYSLIDILVLPSINSTEAFGMVQVEAMLWGVPVVASNLPGVRIPILKTGMGIIIPSKNSKKMAEAIYEIISNKTKYTGKKYALKEFKYDNVSGQWDKLFFG